MGGGGTTTEYAGKGIFRSRCRDTVCDVWIYSTNKNLAWLSSSALCQYIVVVVFRCVWVWPVFLKARASVARKNRIRNTRTHAHNFAWSNLSCYKLSVHTCYVCLCVSVCVFVTNVVVILFCECCSTIGFFAQFSLFYCKFVVFYTFHSWIFKPSAFYIVLFCILTVETYGYHYW